MDCNENRTPECDKTESNLSGDRLNHPSIVYLLFGIGAAPNRNAKFTNQLNAIPIYAHPFSKNNTHTLLLTTWKQCG